MSASGRSGPAGGTRRPRHGRDARPRSGLPDDADDASDRPIIEAALTRQRHDGWAIRRGDPPANARLAALRRRYHDLGAANPFAVSEYAEVRARLDALEAQERDLRDAITATRSLIADLTALIADQFRSTFQALEGAFDARFRQLFGGGYAKLSLTDPDDLAATGVEIVAGHPARRRRPSRCCRAGSVP